MKRRLSFWLASLCVLVVLRSAISEESSSSLERLQADVEFLASDDLEGRGPGTEGLAKAAQFIRDEFRKAGLESGTSDGSYFQPFEVSLGETVIPEETHVVLHGPNGEQLD